MRGLAARWGGPIALLAGSLAVVAAAGEVFFRTLSRETAPVERDGRLKHRFNVFRPDPRLGYALRPDWSAVHETDEFRVVVHTNALGLRGAPADPRPPPGVRRVLVVGDSFAFGWGVADAETFAARLDAALGPGVEVLNAAVPGWGVDQYRVFLRERGFALAPHVLLVATCSNDVGDLGWNAHELDGDGLPVRVESRRFTVDHRGRLHHTALDDLPFPDLPLAGLAGRSHFANWLRYRLARLWVSWAERAELERDAPERAPPGPVAALSAEQIREGLASGLGFRHRYYRHVMQDVAREAAARGIALRTVHVGPYRQELSADCRSGGRPCLDVTELFTRESAPEAFYPVDGHWTPEGHRRVAEALSAWLRSDPALAPAR